MSKENLARFMSKVADSEELQAKIGEEIDAEALIALGAECGCEFSAEDLSEAAELSDDELDSIAGGFADGAIAKGRIAPRSIRVSSDLNAVKIRGGDLVISMRPAFGGTG